MVLIGFMQLFVQLVLLSYIVKSYSRTGDIILLKLFNPAGFLALFFILFFVVEQVIYMLSGFNMMGLEGYPPDIVKSMFLTSQQHIMIFFSGILLGSYILRPKKTSLKIEDFRKTIDRWPGFFILAVLILFLISGIAANIYLGRQFTELTVQGAFRSQLVKSSSGLIITTIGFFGNFAFVALCVYFIRKRQFWFAALIFIPFAGAILYTGARGRLLWPIVIIAIALFSYKNSFPLFKVILFAILGFVLLSVLDPLRKALVDRSYQFQVQNMGLYLSSLLSGRNFDGFSNFTLIVGTNGIQTSLSYLLKGIRVEFMNTFFPGILDRGVAFGTTLPGYFYASGGKLGLFLLSIIYGLSLSLINGILRSVKNVWLFYAYFFAMTWYCAIGGDFVDSLDKLFVASFPALSIYILQYIHRLLGTYYGLRQKN